MIEFGKTLRLAREAKGYSVSQLAEATRMINQTIEDLENENFTRIAAPIYGRGFVKLYCEEVGLDPKPMIAEFMEIFNGNRELGIKERPVAQPVPDAADADEMPKEDVPEPSADEPPPAKSFAAGQSALYSGNFLGGEMEVSPSAPPAAQTAKAKLSRYASPLRETSLPSIPPTAWRIATLAAGAILLLWALAMGFKALYRATSGAETSSAAEEETRPVKATAGVPAASEREKVEVPPLYVD
ncbi:MAG: helix-turn-helix domain-containing protein [Kiritimatiellae bacterium]|nr:helix-turn-helix domain-containing protein [Kiritimatiellia bacterium]